MPTFEITSPDGKVFQVDAPEGATEQDALAHIQSSYKPQEQVSTGEDMAASAGSGLAQGAMSAPFWLGDMANAVVQGAARVGGAAYMGMGGDLSPEMAKALTNVQPFYGSQEILSPVVDFYEPKTTAGKVTNVVANLVGNVGGAKAIQKVAGGMINPSRVAAPQLQNETLIGKNPDLKTYGGEEIGGKLTSAEQAAYGAKEAAYKTAESAKATVAPDIVKSMADDVDSALAHLDPEQVTSVKSIRKYTQELRDLSASDNVSGVKYNTIEKLRQRINNIPYKTETSAGKSAALKAFDDSLDGILQKGLIDGDPQAISLIKEARSKNAYWRKTFSGDKANNLIYKYIEESKAGGANALPPEALFDKFINVGDAGYGNVKALKSAVGEDITPTLKAGFYNRLHTQSLMADGETINPQKMAKSIDTFLSKNQTLANEVFTPDEINALKRTSGVAAKYAKTGVAPKGIVAKISTKLPAIGPLIEQALQARGYGKMVKDLSAPPIKPEYPSVLPMLNTAPLRLTITPEDKGDHQ